jgi:hypothetical protein
MTPSIDAIAGRRVAIVHHLAHEKNAGIIFARIVLRVIATMFPADPERRWKGAAPYAV